MILGACVKPVGVNNFLKDPSVEEIWKGKTGGNIDIGYENDIPLVLQANIEGEWVTIPDKGLYIKRGDTIDIRIYNFKEYDSYEWYCSNSSTSDAISDASSFTVDTGDPLFNETIQYELSVVGKKDSIPYHAYISIIVES
jgi:hypothetical protein